MSIVPVAIAPSALTLRDAKYGPPAEDSLDKAASDVTSLLDELDTAIWDKCHQKSPDGNHGQRPFLSTSVPILVFLAINGLQSCCHLRVAPTAALRRCCLRFLCGCFEGRHLRLLCLGLGTELGRISCIQSRGFLS